MPMVHEFGILQRAPIQGERYDSYEPEKYNSITVDDTYIEAILEKLDEIDFYWHSLNVPGKGLAYCGITLIPPVSIDSFLAVIKGFVELTELKNLLLEAKKKGLFVIHFGL